MTSPPSCRSSSPAGWSASATPAPPPSPPTVTRSGCCSASPPPGPARRPARSAWPTSTPRRSPRSWSTCRTDRGNSARTRNARLAAIHSLFAYAALRHPEHAALIQRVLAIPGKRRDRTDVTYLTPDETDALLAACDQATRTGRRDHAMLALAVQAGLRVSELTSLTCADIRLQAGPHVHCTGKGRKERDTPLLPAIVRILKSWLAERGGQPGDPLFPGPSGQRLSRDAVERRVKLYYARASAGCPSLAAKHVTVHTLRHSAAMRLLLAGVDITVIALWLGHESLTSTQAYLHADMQQKQEAIEKTAPPGSRQNPLQAPGPAPGIPRKPLNRTPNYAVSDGPGTPVTRAVALPSA